MWLLEDILKATGGRVLKKGKEVFTGISTDSRTIQDGELFVPIVGANFDGHSFIDTAIQISGGGALCDRDVNASPSGAQGTLILVKDTGSALLDLAHHMREGLSGKFIAITGSNGKTTTKEILVNMMKRRFTVHFNEKNLNNLIGVPMSILSISGDPEVCIFELGTNTPGEIKKLALTTDPDVSLITNVNASHLAGLKTIEGILEEKLDLFYYTKEGGRVFVNADDPLIIPRYRDLKRATFTFGIENDAYFHLRVEEDLGWEGLKISIASEDTIIRAKTKLLGRHNLYNILAAASMAFSMGVDKTMIAGAIEEFSSYDKRFQPTMTKRGYVIIDDTYNANPSSMLWAIRTFIGLPASGKRAVILGGMKELGEDSVRYHRQLGAYLKDADIDLIALFGEEAREIYEELGPGRAMLFDDRKELTEYVAARLHAGDAVLVKGSRAFKMEEIVEALK